MVWLNLRWVRVALTTLSMDVLVYLWAEHRGIIRNLNAILHDDANRDRLAVESTLLSSHHRPVLLMCTRLASALLTICLSLNLYFTNNYPMFPSVYGGQVAIKRHRRFSTFTTWCWLLLTFYFATMSYVSVQHYLGNLDKVLPRTVLLCWVWFELCFTTAILVTLIVHFVLIPLAKRKDRYRYSRLMNWRSLTLHYANTTMILVEATQNRFTLTLDHFPVVVVYGTCYILFAWCWYNYIGVFYYFFLDYNKHSWAPAAYALLLIVLSLLFNACALVMSYFKPEFGIELS